MPIDVTKFNETLKEMKRIYDKDPTVSVRSKEFIKVLDAYCVYELERLGIKTKQVKIGGDEGRKKTNVYVKQEVTILGKHKPKDLDMCVYSEESGPLIAISTRSQMSSVGKNQITYYEEIIGDVISLHANYPSLVIGEIYLLPTEPIKKVNGKLMKEKINLKKWEYLYGKITGRKTPDDPPDKYEHFAYLVVDFTKDPPTLHPSIPAMGELKIDNFF